MQAGVRGDAHSGMGGAYADCGVVTWHVLAADGLGSALYNRTSAIDRVKARWPPRATAALDAFLNLSDKGSARGWDMQIHEYTFPV
jgi:hypothetical protein